jgi:hypothetical protein
MADVIQPINPNQIPAPSQTGNVASLTNSSTISTLKSTVSPKAFGDQLKDQAKQKVIQAATQSTLARLEKEKALLIQEGITLDTNHSKTLNQYKKQLDDKIITEEEYNKLVAQENINYESAKKILQEKKDINQKQIDNYLKNPFKKQEDEQKKRKKRLSTIRTQNKSNQKKANKDKTKAIFNNAKKSLVPIISLLLTNKIAEIIAQNSKIEALVDSTNALITEANESGDPVKLDNAKVARNSTIKIIENNEAKITRISDQINRISIYINIFTIVTSAVGPILLSIPVPSPAPDVVTPPKETFRRKVYEPALRLLNGLSALLPIIVAALERAVAILEELKARLLDINGQLDASATIGGNSNLLSNPQFGTILGSYKGFTFALREENNPKFVVRGNKRSYAVAINKQNVEVLKSDSSFTLDPNDLVEQLKLIIDRKNLQG